jgi:hypothetical protein
MHANACEKLTVRKFLLGLIIEVPLIVLQYYKKPSFSLYIYIKKDHDLLRSLNCKNLILHFNVVGVVCNQVAPKNW